MNLVNVLGENRISELYHYVTLFLRNNESRCYAMVGLHVCSVHTSAYSIRCIIVSCDKVVEIPRVYISLPEE